MKRNLALISLCASLLFLLAACGEDTVTDSMDNAVNEAGDMLEEAGDRMDEAVTGTERAMGRSGRDFSDNTGAVTEENGRARYGSERYKQDEQDDPAAAKTRWDLMLDNAHVHDTDGYLLDGENPQNDTF